ncbi:hypothetical protein PBI_EGAD_80 [Arthrobacter phage Egad]|nr:hypothetical protein PBI_EGAD_80 [Arthrobacter phage Egad]
MLGDREKELFWIGFAVLASPFVVAWVGFAYYQAVFGP